MKLLWRCCVFSSHSPKDCCDQKESSTWISVFFLFIYLFLDYPPSNTKSIGIFPFFFFFFGRYRFLVSQRICVPGFFLLRFITLQQRRRDPNDVLSLSQTTQPLTHLIFCFLLMFEPSRHWVVIGSFSCMAIESTEYNCVSNITTENCVEDNLGETNKFFFFSSW